MTSFILGNSFPAESPTQSSACWRAAVSSQVA